MQSVTNASFGPLVAYLVPGAVVLFGLRPFSPTLQEWFASSPANSPTLGGFLYLTVASLAVGMTVSAIRWAVVDSIHARTGLTVPRLDFSRLGANVDAFNLLIEIHYRHYQFYANMFVAVAGAYMCYRINAGIVEGWGWRDSGVLILEIVFFATSRDTLRKYYDRTRQVLGTSKSSNPRPRR